VETGQFVFDERDAWSEHQPSAKAENEFIAQHGWAEYANWHLGIDDAEPEETRAHYKFPYGDFENAAAHLHGMIDAARTAISR
jgi:hypothetical protein